MAKDQIKRQNPKSIDADRKALIALKSFTDYKPVNQKFTVNSIQELEQDMLKKQELETLAEKAYKSCRDNANDAEWTFHNAILGTKDQVIAQYSPDSNETQAIGLKKKSEYKRRGTKK